MRKCVILGLLLVLILLIASCDSDETKVPDQKTSENTAQSKSAENSVESKTAPKFTCRDILPESSFKAIMKYNYEDFDFKEIQEKNRMACSWIGKGDEQSTDLDEMWGTSGQGITISVSWDDETKEIFSYDYKIAFPEGKDIPGVGSKAFTTSSDEKSNPAGIFYILNSNKKYVTILDLLAIGFGSAGPQVEDNFDKAKRIAITVDENLNKY